MRYLSFIASILASFMLTGCYDRIELEEQAFIIALGIDTPKPGIITVMGQVAIPSKLSGTSGQGGGSGGGGGDFQKGTPLVMAKGRTIHEALMLMNSGIERKVNLSHLSAIIFSEKAAKAGLLPHLRALVRYREFRRTHYLFVSKGDIEKIMGLQSPLIESSATRYIEDLHLSSQRIGYAPSIQVEQFLNSLLSPAIDPILPMLSVNEGVLKVGDKKYPENFDKEHPNLHFVSGQIDRAGGNPVECLGTAIFQRDRMVGTLNVTETRYLQLMNGMLRHFVMSVPTLNSKVNYLTVGVRLSRPQEAQIVLQGSKKRLDIKQNIEAELLADQGTVSYLSDKNRALLEKQIATLISNHEVRLVHKLLNKKEVAPFYFIEEARSKFPTYSAFSEYPWKKSLSSLPVQVEVHVTIRRLGSQLNSPTAK